MSIMLSGMNTAVGPSNSYIPACHRIPLEVQYQIIECAADDYQIQLLAVLKQVCSSWRQFIHRHVPLSHYRMLYYTFEAPPSDEWRRSDAVQLCQPVPFKLPFLIHNAIFLFTEATVGGISVRNRNLLQFKAKGKRRRKNKKGEYKENVFKREAGVTKLMFGSEDRSHFLTDPIIWPDHVALIRRYGTVDGNLGQNISPLEIPLELRVHITTGFGTRANKDFGMILERNPHAPMGQKGCVVIAFNQPNPSRNYNSLQKPGVHSVQDWFLDLVPECLTQFAAQRARVFRRKRHEDKRTRNTNVVASSPETQRHIPRDIVEVSGFPPMIFKRRPPDSRRDEDFNLMQRGWWGKNLSGKLECCNINCAMEAYQSGEPNLLWIPPCW